MSNSHTANVYRWVVDDVITKAKPEVVQEGLDESVLDELRLLWETKLAQKGLLDDNDGGNPNPQVQEPKPGPSVPVPSAFVGSFTAQLAGVLPQVGVKREQPENGFDASGVLFQKQHGIPQHDGPGDGDDDDEGGPEDADAAVAQEEEPADDEVLSSDSEEEEDDDGAHEHFLCCQFEKVGRTKNKWKITMKEGVFHINGKDYLFKKAQGEWIF